MGIGEKKENMYTERVNDFWFSSPLFLGQANTFRGYEREDQVQVSPVSEEDKLRLDQPYVRACNKCDGCGELHQLQREWPRLQGGAVQGPRWIRLH